jgi:hypothetical protein
MMFTVEATARAVASEARPAVAGKWRRRAKSNPRQGHVSDDFLAAVRRPAAKGFDVEPPGA